jgi:acyl carrier protein
MDTDIHTIKQKVKRELADFLGVGIEDIEDESEFTSDFHMTASDMTDFMDILEKSGVSTDGLDLTNIESFSDLVDEVTAHV